MADGFNRETRGGEDGAGSGQKGQEKLKDYWKT